MKTVVLRLEGPLQSWGTQGRFSTRDTDREPSKSGVLGLVGAALGMERDDDEQLKTLVTMAMVVRVDHPGNILIDYHTVGGGKFRGRRHGIAETPITAITSRHYLADASFAVALGTADVALAERIAAALRKPRWPLFLGRKACSPSAPVLVGVHDSEPLAALTALPWVPRSNAHDDDRTAEHKQLRFVVEADTGEPRADVPLSFRRYFRQHGQRFVQSQWHAVPVYRETQETF